ncbi:alpha/beta hydrolase [Fulvivirga lutea]|uniref:Alpha/beta hydrolase n=2 Tax=Fulvivirga lutea TaxID=2810512 RepID=A0A974WJM6_9BACT|nr:alpha/beta hydrolase [Fulvivirga lutea]
MLAFHGFGLTGECFKPICEVLKKEYTIISFDLFYHGKSHWGTPDRKLTKKYWNKLLATFLKELDIDNFSILAFSLGGKFALATLEQFPKRVNEMMMLAPDGIQTQIWYNLATYPVAFQTYFKSMIVKPNRFFNILDLIKKMGLLDKGISKFAASQMNSIKKRRRVYYSWVVFKDLTFDLKKIAQLINENNIGFTMYLGAYDKIITKEGMKKLTSKLKTQETKVLDCGHNNLIDHTAAFLDQNR